MKLSTVHLKRDREIAGLLWKYGRSDLVKQLGIDAEEARDNQGSKPDSPAEPAPKPASNGAATPEGLVADLEAMGPTYVKLGQSLLHLRRSRRLLAGRKHPAPGLSRQEEDPALRLPLIARFAAIRVPSRLKTRRSNR